MLVNYFNPVTEPAHLAQSPSSAVRSSLSVARSPLAPRAVPQPSVGAVGTPRKWVDGGGDEKENGGVLPVLTGAMQGTFQKLSAAPELKFLTEAQIQGICAFVQETLAGKTAKDDPYFINKEDANLPAMHLFGRPQILQVYLKVAKDVLLTGGSKEFSHAVCITFSEKLAFTVAKVARLMLKECTPANVANVKNEIAHLERFKNLAGVCKLQNYAKYVDKDGRDQFVMYQDLYAFDLVNHYNTHLKGKSKVDRHPIVMNLAKEILQTLVEVHKAGTVHRDLKPQNAFVAFDGRVILADFEYAEEAHSLKYCLAGTGAYFSPERLTNASDEKENGTAMDMWAVGCMVHEIYHGMRPRIASFIGDYANLVRLMGRLESDLKAQAVNPALIDLIDDYLGEKKVKNAIPRILEMLKELVGKKEKVKVDADLFGTLTRLKNWLKKALETKWSAPHPKPETELDALIAKLMHSESAKRITAPQALSQIEGHTLIEAVPPALEGMSILADKGPLRQVAVSSQKGFSWLGFLSIFKCPRPCP